MGSGLPREKREGALRRCRNVEVRGRNTASGRSTAGLISEQNMKSYLRYGAPCLAVLVLAFAFSLPVGAQEKEYTINVMPPGGPPPRLPNGRPDLSGHWFPNGAGQGVSGRFGVDPAAQRTFDPKVTPEEPPSFQPWALEKIKSMTPTDLELSKS